jgi:hypothetical protein
MGEGRVVMVGREEGVTVDNGRVYERHACMPTNIPPEGSRTFNAPEGSCSPVPGTHKAHNLAPLMCLMLF